MIKTLSETERNQILNTLTDKQRSYIKDYIKRGKKTVFANHMAKDKGMVLPQDISDHEVEQVLDGWILDDYLDEGEQWKETKALKCECGRILRYQYVVRHLQTGEIRKFGINHFEEHTGLHPDLVHAIMKGFQTIDYELDEILHKIESNWNVDQVINRLSSREEIPDDIQAQLSLGLPLLDRQMKSLNRILNSIPFSPVPTEETEEQLQPTQVNMFGSEHGHRFDELSLISQNTIMSYLSDGVTSVRIICELMIRDHQVSKERYITGKPKIYPGICMFLDQQSSVYLKQHSLVDRKYSIE